MNGWARPDLTIAASPLQPQHRPRVVVVGFVVVICHYIIYFWKSTVLEPNTYSWSPLYWFKRSKMYAGT